MVKRIMPKSLLPVLGLKDRLTFGKYRGRSLEVVLRDEPSYIRWLIGDKIVELTDEARAVYEASVYAQRYDREMGDAFFGIDPDSMAAFINQ